jgi:hypothetical protein
MWEPRRLTTLWTSTDCYRDSFTLAYIDIANSTSETTSIKFPKLRLIVIGRSHGIFNDLPRIQGESQIEFSCRHSSYTTKCFRKQQGITTNWEMDWRERKIGHYAFKFETERNFHTLKRYSIIWNIKWRKKIIQGPDSTPISVELIKSLIMCDDPTGKHF